MMNLKPLSVIKKRKVKTMPPHFSKIEINEYDLLDHKMENWIVSKLNGRYSISKEPLVKDNILKSLIFIGFEEHQESTFFTLGCPYYRRTK
jgi:hypothetical protein